MNTKKCFILLIVFLLCASIAIAGGKKEKAKGSTELRVALDDFQGEILDPNAGRGAGARLLTHMYDFPIEIAPGGAMAPGIVERWEVSPDSVTLYIRKGVVFHNGDKLTAEDVGFSYYRAATGGSSDAGTWIGMLGEKPTYEVLDEYTVKINTAEPAPYFPVLGTKVGDCVYIVPKDYTEEHGTDYFLTHPIGSGPYKFASISRGDSMEFEAVDYDHWRVNPDFDRLSLYQVPEENTRVAMLETGTVDAIPVSTESAQALKKKDFTTITGDVSVAQFMTVGSYLADKTMPLSDIRVRKALSLAINRQQLIDKVFLGFGYLPAPIRTSWEDPDISGMAPATLKKWKDWAANAFRYDLNEAKRLLAEAGYPDGFSFDFWNIPDGDAPYLGDVVVAVAGFWAQIGIDANISTVDGSVYKAHRHTSKSTELIGKMYSAASLYPKPSTIDSLDKWTSEYSSVDLLVGHPDQAEFDKLWSAGMIELDPAVREGLLDQMMEIHAKSWTGMPIVGTSLVFAFGPRVDPFLPLPVITMSSYYANWKYTGVE